VVDVAYFARQPTKKMFTYRNATSNRITHKNGCAIFQCLVPAARHGNNGDTEVDAECVDTEEAEEGKYSDHVASSLPEVPGRAQTVVHTSEKHDLQV
jgi:hypothetical protein